MIPPGLEVDVVSVDTYDTTALISVAKDVAAIRDVRGAVGWRERDVEGTAAIAEELGLPGHPLSAVRAVQDKSQCRDLVRDVGGPAVAHYAVGATGANDSEVTAFPLPAIVKPTGSSASRAIYRASSRAQLLDAIGRVRELTQPDLDPIFQRFAGQVLIEEYVSGTEHSVEGICLGGELCLGYVTDKWVELKHHIEYQQLHPSSLDPTEQEQMITAAARMISAAGLGTGAVHVEFKMDDRRSPRLIEINPRAGGNYITSHLVKLARGIDFIEYTIAVSCGLPLDQGAVQSQAVAGSREYLANDEGRFTRLLGLDSALEVPGIRHIALERPISSNVALPPKSFTQGVLATIICAGFTRKVVLDDLEAAAGMLKPVIEPLGA